MGSSGLFGAKLVTKFGPLNISTVLGREKAIKNSKTYTGGQSDEGYTLQDYNFVKDKYSNYEKKMLLITLCCMGSWLYMFNVSYFH